MTNILGINLSGLTPSEISDKIKGFLNSPTGHYIVTPNPEIILASHHDEELFFILNQADLAVADGFGLKIAAWIMRGKVYRLTGADLTLELLALAATQKLKTMILFRKDGLSSAQEINKALSEKYPTLIYKTLAIERESVLTEAENKIVTDFAPTLVFAAVGSPYQEKIVYHGLKVWPSVRLALGVGGAFDFISEKIKRAPQGFRQLGLEWLWRLIKQPKRIGRIYNATFVFMNKLIKVRLVYPHLYRPNVACWVYKKENGQIKILLLERRDEAGHWQLPQGGRDGESAAKAGAREIWEETGLKNIAARGVFKNLYHYDFPPTNRRRGDDEPRLMSRRFQSDYRGQKQDLFVAEFLGQDTEIKINYWDHNAWRWVNLENILDSVYPNRREATEIFLDKFLTLNIK